MWTEDEGCTCKDAQIEDGCCNSKITAFNFGRDEE
jgi:hypothetical protein